MTINGRRIFAKDVTRITYEDRIVGRKWFRDKRNSFIIIALNNGEEIESLWGECPASTLLFIGKVHEYWKKRRDSYININDSVIFALDEFLCCYVVPAMKPPKGYFKHTLVIKLRSGEELEIGCKTLREAQEKLNGIFSKIEALLRSK